MIHQDFIMRQVTQLSRALAQVIFFRQNKKYDEALAEIQTSGELFLGLHLDDGRTVTYSEVMAAFEKKKMTGGEETSLVAEMIRQKGEIHAIRDESKEAEDNLKLALHLFLDLFDKKQEIQTPDYVHRIDLILTQFDEYHLSPDVQKLLFSFYDRVNRYDKAENMLFMLADAPDDSVYHLGMAFYARIRRLTNTKLVKGGLSREEVWEGITAFQQKCNMSDQGGRLV